MALMNRESVIQTPSEKNNLNSKEVRKRKQITLWDNFFGEFLGNEVSNVELQEVCDKVRMGTVGAMK